MSMEAQFYEARRRQSFIDRRNSLSRASLDIPRPKFQPEYHAVNIPVRIFRSESVKQQPSWATIAPPHRSKIVHTDQSLFRRDRDIYPRTTTTRKFIRGAVLLKRFSSTEYMQQW